MAKSGNDHSMNPEKGTKSARGRRYVAGGAEEIEDSLTVEAPLHLKVNGESYTTTMRTPGDDEALARGLLFTEGIVSDPGVALGFRAVEDPESGGTACLEISVPEESLDKSVEGRRTMLSASSCGVCGTRDPADIEIYGPPLGIASHRRLDVMRIPSFIQEMRKKQHDFSASGGSHAAAIFTAEGKVLAVKEDIGRHNAVDKAVGSLLAEGRLSEAAVLLVSGRVSYEIVYKAYRARIPFVLAVSAPSSMAVETGERLGMTIAAFCRDDRATVYSHSENVAGVAAEVKG